jgi:hypothetical protein
MTKLSTISILETVRETEKAVLVHLQACLKIGGGMTGIQVWLPKSGLTKVNGEDAIPTWLANKIEYNHGVICSVGA